MLNEVTREQREACAIIIEIESGMSLSGKDNAELTAGNVKTPEKNDEGVNT